MFTFKFCCPDGMFSVPFYKNIANAAHCKNTIVLSERNNEDSFHQVPTFFILI